MDAIQFWIKYDEMIYDNLWTFNYSSIFDNKTYLQLFSRLLILIIMDLRFIPEEPIIGVYYYRETFKRKN